jgi:hypothetical protein
LSSDSFAQSRRELSDPWQFDQGIAGFLDHIMKRNFAGFIEPVGKPTGKPVEEIERIADDGNVTGSTPTSSMVSIRASSSASTRSAREALLRSTCIRTFLIWKRSNKPSSS